MRTLIMSPLKMLTFPARDGRGALINVFAVPGVPVSDPRYGHLFDAAGQKLAIIDRDREGNPIVEVWREPLKPGECAVNRIPVNRD